VQILRVEGGSRLYGEVRVSGAKNAVLPILAAAILTDDPVTLEDVPRLTDVEHMLDILSALGSSARRQDDQVFLSSDSLEGTVLPDPLAKKLRSSIFLLGPMLGRLRRAVVTYPGGCDIGLRPIDLHLQGLSALGVQIQEEGGLIYCDGRNLRGGTVHFDYPSVGATENVMMAAVLAPGRTVIHNAAREPEIADLQNFLNAMGARIAGGGTHTLSIEGVSRLHGVHFRPMPDRIAAATLLAAFAITGGEGTVSGAQSGALTAVCAKLREMGCLLKEEPEKIHIAAPERLHAFRTLHTAPHPGFPTDMQAQTMALAALCQGVSIIEENVFENRFTHVPDFCRMGADIRVIGRTAVIRGVPRLHGARVVSHDLRGGAALVLAGLGAEGITEIEQPELIDRGYDHLEDQLSSLGARILRLQEGNSGF